MFNEEFDSVLKNHPRWIFASVVGSHNYGTATEHSDVDMKVMYLPTFEEFFKNKFDRTSDAGPDAELDYTCHPFQEYVRHTLKGNMNFWELWFSDHLRYNPEFIDGVQFNEFKKQIQRAVGMNFTANYHATRGMAMEKFKRFSREIHRAHMNGGGEDSPLQIDRHNKELQHAVRLLSTLLHYEKVRSISLVLPEEFASYRLLRQLTHPIEVSDGRKLFQELDEAVMDLRDEFYLSNDGVEHYRNVAIKSVNEMVFDWIRRCA